jgi:hypothetical protein
MLMVGLAMFGENAVFLRSITAIKDDQAVEFMTAAGLSIASVTKAAASAIPNKGSKATAVDLEKVISGFSHSDNIATRDLDSESVNKHIVLAKALEVEGSGATPEQQYQFLVTHATCYALLVLGFRIGLKVQNPGNMEFVGAYGLTAYVGEDPFVELGCAC